MNDSQKDAICRALRERSADNRVPCRGAFEIAAALGVDTRLVGEAADELGIKIISCQLGCF